MTRYKRLMVGLDLTLTDQVIIRFICSFMKINPGIESIYFVHVEQNLENADSIKHMGLRDSGKPFDEILLQEMHDEVKASALVRGKVEMHFEILEGDPLHQLLHWAQVKKIDLIVSGKKKRADGKGIVMEKFAQHSQCSILFIPQHHSLRFDKIVVPIDFSKTSEHVLERICAFSRYLPRTRFIGLNVVEVPGGYTKIGKTFEEFSQSMIKNAKRRWEVFQYNLPFKCSRIEPYFEICRNHNVAKTIFEYAEENNADMIIIGSHEMTDTAHFLLGSVAEKVIGYDYSIVLLVVKQHVEEEVVDFFKAVKKI